MWGGEGDDDDEMLCRLLQRWRMRGGIASRRTRGGLMGQFKGGRGGTVTPAIVGEEGRAVVARRAPVRRLIFDCRWGN